MPVQLSIFPKEHHLISSNICKRRNVTTAKWGIIDVSQIGYHLKIWCLVTSALILLIEMKNVTTAKWGVIDVSQRSHHLAEREKDPNSVLVGKFDFEPDLPDLYTVTRFPGK